MQVGVTPSQDTAIQSPLMENLSSGGRISSHPVLGLPPGPPDRPPSSPQSGMDDADTSDSTIAEAILFQGTLTVIPVTDGSATITATPQDADGNTVAAGL